ncbi:MAG: hypothetical protein C5B49_01660, partial [Bdellovibrio sp.]
MSSGVKPLNAVLAAPALRVSLSLILCTLFMNQAIRADSPARVRPEQAAQAAPTVQYSLPAQTSAQPLAPAPAPPSAPAPAQASVNPLPKPLVDGESIADAGKTIEGGRGRTLSDYFQGPVENMLAAQSDPLDRDLDTLIKAFARMGAIPDEKKFKKWFFANRNELLKMKIPNSSLDDLVVVAHTKFRIYDAIQNKDTTKFKEWMNYLKENPLDPAYVVTVGVASFLGGLAYNAFAAGPIADV